MAIILDKKKGPSIKGKDLCLADICDALAGGKTLKEISAEFSLTEEELKETFEYFKKLLGETTCKKGALVAYTDGASRGNPGEAGIGIVLYDDSGNILEEINEYIGKATNNIAEYRALIKALEVSSSKFCASSLSVFADSQLIVKQVLGEYKVKEASLKGLFTQARDLIRKFDKFEITHIEREKNKHADKLANAAINLK
ncbi:MAG: ribonuclease HI family protein [bacterium]